MAELDEGIGNLEAFNSLVGDTSTRLTSDTGALESQARTIDGLESDAQAAFDGLDDRLEELHARLDDERSQACIVDWQGGGVRIATVDDVVS